MPEPESIKSPTVIRTPDQHLRVFISSTLNELAEERDAVRQSVLKLRLAPVMFEAGARPHPAREVYQAYLSQSQIFIGIYWQRYGWIGPGMEISGLEDEYNLSAAMPRLLYMKTPAPERESRLVQMLTRIEQENTASYKKFTSTAELGELVANDLALLLSESYEAASRGVRPVLHPRPLTNLPFPRNSLLGRDRELAALCEWLGPQHAGLVTVTGTGGTGKSRLALEAALRLRDRFPDGAYLVPLTPVRDPARVIPAIAAILGLRENPQGLSTQEILFEYLRSKHMLLLLDNFEQVLDAAPEISRLVEACPGLQLLVTSRAPLHLRAEREFVLQPLKVPAPADAGDPERLSQYAAVELFIQRAQAVQPDFQVTNENAPAVAEICARLEGLPLAIELAASRIRLLRPEQLLKRLGHRFDLLRGGTRDLPERQQTLRRTISWSYDLLSKPAQALFRRLSVFSGGWSLEAAEAVCNPDGDLGASILEEMEALVDMSLITPVAGLEDQQRFTMLESIHEYALERLVESGELPGVRELHARCFLEFVREVEPRIRTAERLRWRGVLEQDFENIRSVLRWGLEDSAGRLAAQQIAIQLEYFWPFCGYLREGLEYVQQFTALMDSDTPPAIRADLLGFSGIYGLIISGKADSLPLLQEGVAYARQAGDRKILARCLQWSGLAAMAGGNLPAAVQELQESLVLLRELGDNWSQVLSLLWLSEVQRVSGEVDLARQTLDQSVLLGRGGDPSIQEAPLGDVAQDALSRGDLQAAESILLEMDSLARPVGDHWSLAWVANTSALVELQRAHEAPAAGRIVEALESARLSGNMQVTVLALVEAALILARRDPGGDAARLCAASRNVISDTMIPRGFWMRTTYDNMLEEVRVHVGEPAWEAAFGEGAGMPVEQAVDLALAGLQSV
ncbi:MAG: DUF4062 domain-containing protein [Bacteroidota bacterium]